MKEQISVSIIVPVYNEERTLEDCVLSILAQKLINIEVLLINDGSKDRSGEICEQFAKVDKRVKVYHISNSGPAAARNVGINHASGKYLGFVDADDIVEHQMYDAMFHAAVTNDADVVMCNYNAVNTNGERRNVRAKPCEVLRENTAIREQIIKRYYTGEMIGIPSLWNKIFNTALINKYGIRIDESLIRAEDYWFNFEVLKKANCFVMIEDAYYNYRDINPNSIMHHYLQNQFDEWKKSRKRLMKEGEQLGFCLESGVHNAFSYNVQQYILHLINCKQKQTVLSIFQDEMYRAALASSRLAIWSRFASYFVLHNRYQIAYYIYWAVEKAKTIRYR